MIAGVLALTNIIGGVLGDLILGNRLSIIIGGVVGGLGVFMFCLDNIYSFSIGLFLHLLGAGLYSPNLSAAFGKLFLHRKELLDSAFASLYVVINIAVFIGVLTLDLINEIYGFECAFVLGGLCFWIAAVFALILQSESTDLQVKYFRIQLEQPIKIVGILILTGLFWIGLEMWGAESNSIISEMKVSGIAGILSFDIMNLNIIFIIILILPLLVIWNLSGMNRIIKMGLGFIFAIIGFVMLMAIPDQFGQSSQMLIVASFLLFTLAEMHIAPLLYSAITDYGNPRWLAIFIGLAYMAIFAIIKISDQIQLFILPELNIRALTSTAGIVISGGCFFILAVLYFTRNSIFPKRQADTELEDDIF